MLENFFAKKGCYTLGQLAVDESWVDMYITTRATSEHIPGICLLQLGHLESRCGMWLVKLAYSKQIWVWVGPNFCFANCLGRRRFLGAKHDEKLFLCKKMLLYPCGQLAVDESWVNMCITTCAPSKQIPGICLLQLGHLDVAGLVWGYWPKWFVSRSASQADTNDMKFEEARFKVTVSNKGN